VSVVVRGKAPQFSKKLLHIKARDLIKSDLTIKVLKPEDKPCSLNDKVYLFLLFPMVSLELLLTQFLHKTNKLLSQSAHHTL